MDDTTYAAFLREETARTVKWQEDLGLDVLVGEEGFSRVPNPFVLGVMAGGEE